ncbi:hypothetical protein ACFL37_01130 [Candidatus Margulisiibacteriota bacterium]
MRTIRRIGPALKRAALYVPRKIGILAQPRITKNGNQSAARTKLAKECLGQFGVTALAGGAKLEARYRRQIGDDITLKAMTASKSRPHCALDQSIFMRYDLKGTPYQAGFKSGLLIGGVLEKLSAKIMNKYWPGQAIRRNRMLYALGITDAPKTPKELMKLAEECLGEFGVTALTKGGKIEARYLSDSEFAGPDAYKNLTPGHVPMIKPESYWEKAHVTPKDVLAGKLIDELARKYPYRMTQDIAMQLHKIVKTLAEGKKDK